MVAERALDDTDVDAVVCASDTPATGSGPWHRLIEPELVVRSRDDL